MVRFKIMYKHRSVVLNIKVFGQIGLAVMQKLWNGLASLKAPGNVDSFAEV